jgi:hypothetical protein
MFSIFKKKPVEVDGVVVPPGKTAAHVKASTCEIDSRVFHLFQWDGFGFIVKPYSGDLIPTQIFYPKILIELPTDSILIGATAEVLVVGDQLAAKWVSMSGAEARWLKRYFLRHGPGHNPNIQQPAEAGAADQPAEDGVKAAEKPSAAPKPKK